MSDIYTFHVNLFTFPQQIGSEETILLRDLPLRRLLGDTGGSPNFAAPLSVTWDQAAAILEEFDRMIFEPDGSWVWSGNDADGKRWQVDGQFTEVGDFLHHIECHGRCPLVEFDQLLRAIGWPTSSLAFELVQEGITIDESSFRQWASAKSSPRDPSDIQN